MPSQEVLASATFKRFINSLVKTKNLFLAFAPELVQILQIPPAF